MRTIKENLVSIPNRVLELICKLISRKGVMLGGTFYLVKANVFDGWYQVVAWVFICLFVIGGVEAVKWFQMFKDLKD